MALAPSVSCYRILARPKFQPCGIRSFAMAKGRRCGNDSATETNPRATFSAGWLPLRSCAIRLAAHASGGLFHLMLAVMLRFEQLRENRNGGDGADGQQRPAHGAALIVAEPVRQQQSQARASIARVPAIIPISGIDKGVLFIACSFQISPDVQFGRSASFPR